MTVVTIRCPAGPAPPSPAHLPCLQLVLGQGAHGEPDVETDPAKMGVPICSWVRALQSQGLQEQVMSWVSDDGDMAASGCPAERSSLRLRGVSFDRLNSWAWEKGR